ncbi:signal recognition particle-docking protein FtsY [Acuticoccus sp. MNP-M23]|uniref:signal recognition particle-docking protein FtsY n=1 Tax=Acuticoccus sp. MNP-M23 TaxID=3072793 RepID=UPI0028162154|nr:signal recognition particle-docking protein FtsY [Acuticoccus sp. MNP-M23]WMS43192.1 signal recognition particle-docking protein FtsY [Acuticoccus sp. MNP-M23]
MSEGRRSFWGFGRKKADDPKADAASSAPAAPAETAQPGTTPTPPVPATDTASAEPKKRWFSRLTSGLSRSSSKLGDSVSGLFTKKKLDASSLQDLEDILIEADLGIETAMAITDRLSESRFAKGIEAEELQEVLASEIEKVLAPLARPLEIGPAPYVVLVVGVNGTGKTTTIGKIAAQQAAAGKRVVLAAGDTFRAAAVAQLKIWGERSGATVVSGEQGADPAGLVFDAMDKAASADLLIVDTAGRLQNKAELMAELEKIVRIIKRKNPAAPHAVLLTLDATTGQNAMNQVDIFKKSVGVTGLVMTKLDGTARGGILVAIGAKHGLPIHFIGVGEGVDDLAPFAARDYARAIAGLV